MADSSRIDQILFNLVTNARDAMEGCGDLMISSEQITLSDDYIAGQGCGKPGRYALMTITDTGKGMDEETIKNIFEPFFTTKEVGKGTGLGLFMVYGIIMQHKGYIDVSSEPDEGSIFTIYLPAAPSGTVVEQKQEGPLHLAGTETILLAEDDKSIMELTKDHLERYGYTVIAAQDGEEAVRLFQEHKDAIDFFLMDVIMPKMNGKEVLERVKKEKPHARVLFMSGYPGDVLQQRGVLEEGIALVSKPISPNDLLKKIRTMLDKTQ